MMKPKFRWLVEENGGATVYGPVDDVTLLLDRRPKRGDAVLVKEDEEGRRTPAWVWDVTLWGGGEPGLWRKLPEGSEPEPSDDERVVEWEKENLRLERD